MMIVMMMMMMMKMIIMMMIVMMMMTMMMMIIIIIAELSTFSRCARWCDNSVLESLPLPCEEVQKFVVMETADMDHLPEDCIDTYLDLYRPFQLAFLDENFFFKLIPHSLRYLIKLLISFKALHRLPPPPPKKKKKKRN